MDKINITKKKKPSVSNDRKNMIGRIKLLKKGECLEYRGEMRLAYARQMVGEASTWLDRKFSGRAVEGGIDIYCE
jgi:hypothetical protein